LMSLLKSLIIIDKNKFSLLLLILALY